MAWKTFDDTCRGCLPAMLDASTGECLPDNHPLMIAIMRVWNTLTLSHKRAFHRFTCLNSRDPVDLLIVGYIRRRFQAAMAEVKPD